MHSQGLRSNTFTLWANNHNSKHVRMRTYAKIYAKGKLLISFLTTDYDNENGNWCIGSNVKALFSSWVTF